MPAGGSRPERGEGQREGGRAAHLPHLEGEARLEDLRVRLGRRAGAAERRRDRLHPGGAAGARRTSPFESVSPIERGAPIATTAFGTGFPPESTRTAIFVAGPGLREARHRDRARARPRAPRPRAGSARPPTSRTGARPRTSPGPSPGSSGGSTSPSGVSDQYPPSSNTETRRTHPGIRTSVGAKLRGADTSFGGRPRSTHRIAFTFAASTGRSSPPRCPLADHEAGGRRARPRSRAQRRARASATSAAASRTLIDPLRTAA